MINIENCSSEYCQCNICLASSEDYQINKIMIGRKHQSITIRLCTECMRSLRDKIIEFEKDGE